MLTITRALDHVRRAAPAVPMPSDLSQLLLAPLPSDALPCTAAEQPDAAISLFRSQVRSGAALRDLLAADSHWHEAVDEEVLDLPATCVVGANCLALMTRVDQLLLDMGDVQNETAWPVRLYAAGQMAVWHFG